MKMLISWSASEIAQSQTAKSLPAMWETWVRSLGQEDPLEKEITTHSSILAWRIPWTEEPGRLQSMELQRVRHDRATSLSFPKLGSRYVIIQIFWRISDPAMEDEYTDLREEIP